MRDPLHRVSVRDKLALMFFGLCLLMFGVGGSLITSSARSTLEQEILGRLEYQARAYAAGLDGHLKMLTRRTEDFASDGLIRDHVARLTAAAEADDPAEVSRLRDELARHLAVNKLPLEPSFADLAVSDEAGRLLVAVVDAESPTVTRLAQEAIGDGSDRTWSSDMLAGGEAGPPGFVISAALLDLDGQRVIGRILARVHAGVWISSALRSVGTGEERQDLDVRLSLHDRRRRRLDVPTGFAGPDAPRADSEFVLGGHGLTVVEDDVGVETGAEDYAPLRGAFSRVFPVATNGWSVQVSLASEKALQPIAGLQSRVLGVGLVLAAVSMALLYFPMRFLARPLRLMERAAQRISEGDLDTRVTVESSDEIGLLAASFNHMSEALQDRTSKLEATAGDLRAREREVRSQHDQLDAVIASMRDGLAVIDDAGEVVLSNAAAAPLLAQRSQVELELHGRHVCEDGRQHGRSDCDACLLGPTGEPRSCLVNLGARVFEVHTSTVPPDEHGRVSRVLVSRDVTDRVTQDEQQIHQERLAVLGEVAAVMAHELNNPLASISMFNQMLASELPPDSELLENCDVIQRNTESCTATIRELLDYSTGASPEVGLIDIHATIDDVIRFLRPVSERLGVRVHGNLSAENPWVTGDEVQVRQVFVNLVMNGVQAVDGEGEVELSTRLEDERLVVDVRDTGGGIAPEDRSQVFRPFFTTKTRGQGTGLGLPTARRITEMQGGSLELVESSPAGTLFRVRLRSRTAVEVS